MKTITTAKIENVTLYLLVEAQDKKATASYFINGFEVTDWKRTKPIFQTIFSAMFDDFCNANYLEKYSY